LPQIDVLLLLNDFLLLLLLLEVVVVLMMMITEFIKATFFLFVLFLIRKSRAKSRQN
jgi:hypothetical protein